MTSKLIHCFRCALFECYSTINRKRYRPLNERIDIVIMAVEKDLSVLPLCVEGIRKYVQHDIAEIYVVSPDSEGIRNFCAQNHCEFVNENTIFGFSPKELNLFVTNAFDGNLYDRSGWLFQQLVKLSGRVGSCKNYLCVDADHVIIRPMSFLANDGKPIFYLSREHHPPYRRMSERLLNRSYNPIFSHIAHKMIFNKERLKELRHVIESYSDKDWLHTILEKYDRRESSGFSEFELYGGFVKDAHCLPWKNIHLGYRFLSDLETLHNKFGKRYNTVTFPTWGKDL